MHHWIFMDKETHCDVFDPGVFAKIDSALRNLSSSLSGIEYKKEVGEDKTDVAEKLERNCRVIESFFDEIFGSDERKRILDGDRNIMILSGALASFLCYIDEEICSMADEGEKIRETLEARLLAL